MGPQAPQISTPQLPPQMVTPQSNQHVQHSAATPLQVHNVGAGPHNAPQPSQGVMQNPLAANGMAFTGRQVGQPQLAGSIQLQPLPREAFDKAYYEQWLPKHAPKDRSVLNFEGRDIDLYRLHCEVLSAGSYKMVSSP